MTYLQQLQNINDLKFIEIMKNSHNNLRNNDIPELFKILLNHLTKKISLQITNEIFEYIYYLLSIDNYLSIFYSNGYINSLPYSNSNYYKNLLDILLLLSQKIPHSFDERISTFLTKLSNEYSFKCLIIITFYGQSYNELKNPNIILDILFENFENFFKIETSINFISFLIYLLKNFINFRKEKIINCWKIFIKMLNLEDENILNNCYIALSSIFEMDPNLIKTLEYPSENLSIHLHNKNIQMNSLSFLMRCPPLPTIKNMSKIIDSLLILSETNENATLILLGLAMDVNNSNKLLLNSNWMKKGLPKILDTLRLFGIIMLHKNLRNEIINNENIFDFLKNLLSINSIGVTNAICTILRRLPLTPNFLVSLSKSGFLHLYLNTAIEVNDNSVQLSALRIIDSFSKIKFLSEYIEMIDFIILLIKKRGDLSNAASNVAIQLCRYPKCAKIFNDKKLIEYYIQYKDDPFIKKFSEKFLKVYNKVQNL